MTAVDITSFNRISEHPLYKALVDQETQCERAAFETESQVHRVGAILRLLNFRLVNSSASPQELRRDDMSALVELMLETLPADEQDAETLIDTYGAAARSALRSSIEHGERQRLMLAAMAVAANLGSTHAELDSAARTAWETWQLDPTFEPDWLNFCRAIQSRGFVIEIERVNDVISFVIVETPERRTYSRQLDRAQRKFSQAAGDIRSIEATAPVAAKPNRKLSTPMVREKKRR
ncbi:hypothetical protein [Burkholderia sp. LMG 21824]|uniref:hypothetical protein n=1 Tax=Burkholderia sp. LMG 21824 TaxID=3158172 RepID=UPI003C2BA606